MQEEGRRSNAAMPFLLHLLPSAMDASNLRKSLRNPVIFKLNAAATPLLFNLSATLKNATHPALYCASNKPAHRGLRPAGNFCMGLELCVVLFLTRNCAENRVNLGTSGSLRSPAPTIGLPNWNWPL